MPVSIGAPPSTARLDYLMKGQRGRRTMTHWHYAMITPDGQSFWNRLDYLAIDPIDTYSAMDGFCDETGAVSPDMPRSKWIVTFDDASERANWDDPPKLSHKTFDFSVQSVVPSLSNVSQTSAIEAFAARPLSDRALSPLRGR